MKRVAIILALCVLAFLVYYSRTSYARGLSPVDKGNVIVYGSKTCPWCVKQEDYLNYKGIPYTFMDCTKETCPDFVGGFPTLMVDNVMKTGYSEI